MNLTRIYNQDGIVGYASPDRPDFVILMEIPAGTPARKSMVSTEVFELWVSAPKPQGGNQRRALLFFPRLLDVNDAATFARKAVSDGDGWDQATYWCSSQAQGSVVRFPAGKPAVVGVGQWKAIVDPPTVVPALLSDFDWKYNDEQLIFTPHASAWLLTDQHGLAISRGRPATFQFTGRSELLTGAIQFLVDSKLFPSIPLEISFSRATADSESFSVQRKMKARPFSDLRLDEFNKAKDFIFGLDPRDVGNNGSGFSYLEFDPATRLITNLLSDKGLRAIVGTGDRSIGGYARLQFLFEQGSIGTDKKWNPNVAINAVLIPEGYFQFQGFHGLPARERQGLSTRGADSSMQRLLCGASATECLHLQFNDLILFNARKPGIFFSMGDAQAPSGAEIAANGLFHDGGGLVTTSWITAVPKDSSKPTRFVTEPTRSPLFKAGGMPRGYSDPLEREYPSFANLVYTDDSATHIFIPIFPWAGNKSDGELDANLQYEATHLARARRLMLRPAVTITKTPRKGRSKEEPRLCVTPQGLIALVDESNYRRLFFGDPDNSTLNAAPSEFLIDINGGVGDMDTVDQDIQRALRAEDLFFVVAKPSPVATKVFVPKQTIRVRDFVVGLTLDTPSETVVLIKYFRGKSLSDLLNDETHWSCREHLAPNVTSQWVRDRTTIPNATTLEQAAWDAIFTSPDWQGLLLLNVMPGSSPDLFEALGAGMAASNFRFHHLGLDFLPVKGQDLNKKPTPPDPPTPVRTGSAFGLLRYTPRPNTSPPEIHADDHEPTERPRLKSKKPLRKADNASITYKFTVEKLSILFARSQIRHFEAEVHVGFSHLLWDATTGDAASNAVLLKGTFESREGPDGKNTDIFKLVTDADKSIEFQDSWISVIKISDGELNVTEKTDTAPRKITFFIGFTSQIVFKKDKQEFKEFFDVKSVMLERAGLEFDYSPASRDVKCRFRADGARADIERGESTSFLSLLPIKVKGFRIAIDSLLDLGEMKFVPIWGGNSKFAFALDLEIDLGSVGRLGGEGDFKLPVLLGWLKGGLHFCCGIQLPNWDGVDFELGLQQFIAIRAKEVVLKTCYRGDEVNAIALVLKKARLVLLGREWPSDKSELGVALFLPVGKERKLAWVFGLNQEQKDGWLKYIGAGQNVTVDTANTGTAKGIVEKVASYLVFGKQQEQSPDPCELLNMHDPSREGWLAAAHFKVTDLAEIWLAVADQVPLYALQLKLAGIAEVGAAYRRVNDTLGAFSGELNLAESIPPLQFGAASVRLPAIRAEVFTDGGWLIDLGYPWNNDFRRSCQIEVAIYLGSGGVYFGITAAAAADVLAIEQGRYGYEAPDPNSGFIKSLRALRLGFAFRVGIGRSVDLGVLKGEASISIFGGLEGAAAYRGTNLSKPELYAIRGVAGVMVQIWAELDFVVLQARAELCVYAEFGFELRRVLGRKGTQYYTIALPFTVFVEVGIYVHFEVWVTIGCVRVKLFDLTFNKTWRIEEPFGELHAEPIGSISSVQRRRLTPRRPWSWDVRFATDLLTEAAAEPIPLYVMVLPCAANPKDVDRDDGAKYQSCLVSILMLERNEGFSQLAKFMIQWVLKLASDDSQVLLADVIQRRKDLGTHAAWDGDAGGVVLTLLKQRFTAILRQVDPRNLDARFIPVPAWPGVTWGYKQGRPFHARTISLVGKNLPWAEILGDPVTRGFIDFIRLLTESFLAEIDRQIRIKCQGQDLGGAQVVWKDLWEILTTEPTAHTSKPRPTNRRKGHLNHA